MSFGAPLALLGLVAIPMLACWYVRRRGRHAAAQAAFVSAPLLASVAPSRPGWRRHAPLIALLAALAALVVALADPRTTVAATVPNSAIILACDVSGSMGSTDIAPTRLRAAERAALRFLAEVPAHVSVGVMVFNQDPDVLQLPTTDRAADRRALTGWRPHGGTAIGSAIELAVKLLGSGGNSRSEPTAAIVLLSDGGSTSGVDPLVAAREARAHHIPVDTVALGTAHGKISIVAGRIARRITVPVPVQTSTLAAVARAAGGQAFTAASAGRLDEIYERLGAHYSRHKVHRTLEAGFAGAALALLALGGALSLRWFGRLI
jgi:Ca-activated chloride channel family protein